MSLDIRNITKGLTKVVSDLVGYKLTKVRGQGGIQVPAVFIKREAIDRPEYPYVVVDYVGFDFNGSTVRDQYLNSNLDEVTVTEVVGNFTIEVIAGAGVDPLSILQELTERLNTTRGQRVLRESTDEEVGLLDIGNAVSNPTPLQTTFQEVGRVLLRLNLVSVLVDDTTGTIEKANIDGYTYNDFDQQEFPYEIETDVPINSGV